MPITRSSGNLYRVSGANNVSGQDVQITVRAYDEADARRLANGQGVFVSECSLSTGEGTYSDAVLRDPVVRKLIEAFPQLKYRLQRLNNEDRDYLSNLAVEVRGVSHRDAAHVCRVIAENRHLPRA